MTLLCVAASLVLAGPPGATGVGSPSMPPLAVAAAAAAAPAAERGGFLPGLGVVLDTAAPPPQPALLLAGSALAAAGVALTLPMLSHRGCAVSGRCPSGNEALLAGGLFVAGAGLAVSAGAAPGKVWKPPAASELRERLGLDIPLGAPRPGRTTLRWTPFRLQRGGGLRLGVAFL